MGYLGLSVLTDVKHFWYLHNDVNYCSVRALAKCPVSCEISHCWHCLCSPINCSNLRLDAITAVEELTCFEEILTYEVQEGTKMPQACGCPGCATDSSDSSSFCTSDTAVNDHEPLMYGDTGRGKATCRAADLWFCNVTNQLIVVVFLFVCFFPSHLCTANERTPGGPLLHHLHRLCSVHLLLDDHAGHICCVVVSDFNLIPAENFDAEKPNNAFQATDLDPFRCSE